MNENKEQQGLSPEPYLPEGMGGINPDRNKSTQFIKIGVIVLILILGIGVGSLLSKGRQDARIRDLERENGFLRAKLELYAASVDSIHSMLDSLQIKAEDTRDYPYVGGGRSSYVEISLDQPLKQRLRETDTRLVSILQGLGSLMQEEGYQSFSQPLTMENVPGIYPTFGRVSDGWGSRIHPISGQLEFHNGIDISNAAGTPIYATANGKVIKVSYESGYGRYIVIDHGNGYRTLYAHLYSHQVLIGDLVQKGQIIALMGNTGYSTGPHLHYEVHYREARVNPASYLNRIEAYAFR